MAGIRVLDIDRIGLETSDPTAEDLASVGADLVTAFRESGFAYLSRHGISRALQQDTFSVARQFFSLDAPKKMLYERFVKTGYNGYTPIGGENNSYANAEALDLVDYKECYDLHYLGQEYPADVMPQLGPQLELMTAACCQLSRRLLNGLDAALGSGQLLIDSHRNMMAQDGCAELRVLHYPPVPDAVPDNTVRCAAHTDYGTFTLLFQDDVGGLEVETSPGVWEAALLIPDTILVNIGDMAEIWTAGELRATNHRVLLPASRARRATSRQSMVFFVQPDDAVTVAPLCGSDVYQSVNFGEFMRKQFAATYKAFANMPQ